ncbi:hypothetical protein HDU91_005843 [Kappamyces sp. JEL0680]|nr:hypothetical protein HDU91_005843 [Kappamyces sp. JEL0680]
MAKKGKATGGKPKKAKGSSGKESSVPPDKIGELLVVIHSKEELKESRVQFQKIVSANYNEVKRTLAKIDQFGMKEKEMEAAEVLYKKEKEQLAQTLLHSFQAKIASHHDRIDFLDKEIERKSQELQVIVDFGNIPEAVLEGEINELLEIKAAAALRHSQAIEKLKTRHEASIKNTHIRSSRIINAAEDIACTRECNKMSEEAIDEERRNRQLKYQLHHLSLDQVKLLQTIDELEKQHMLLVRDSLQVDWDLRYVEPLDDGILETPDSGYTPVLDLTASLKESQAATN